MNTRHHSPYAYQIRWTFNEDDKQHALISVRKRQSRYKALKILAALAMMTIAAPSMAQLAGDGVTFGANLAGAGAFSHHKAAQSMSMAQSVEDSQEACGAQAAATGSYGGYAAAPSYGGYANGGYGGTYGGYPGADGGYPTHHPNVAVPPVK